MDARRGRAWLLVAGLASLAVYLAATLRLSWWRYGSELTSWSEILGRGGGPFALCLAGVVVLMALYLWGWRLLRRGAPDAGMRRLVRGFALLFAATLFWLLPITSDLFSYLTKAHLFTDLEVNPLFSAPGDYPGDRLLWAYPTRYSTEPSVYGPAWTLLSAPATLGRYDLAGGLIYLKGLVAFAYLGSAWLLERILRQIRPAAATEGFYLFAWNPLVLLMAVGDGHNDIVMMATVLLAVWLLLAQSLDPGLCHAGIVGMDQVCQPDVFPAVRDLYLVAAGGAARARPATCPDSGRAGRRRSHGPGVCPVLARRVDRPGGRALALAR